MLVQQNTIITNNRKEKDVKNDCITIMTAFDLKGNLIFFRGKQFQP